MTGSATRTLGVVPVVVALLFAAPTQATACSLIGSPVPGILSLPESLVAGANWILRVLAVEYSRPPANPNEITTGTPDSRVRFQVLEQLKGAWPEKEIVLPGYVTNRDDFNDQPVPYDFIRPNGRSGSCFANSYKQNGQFLLMLRKLENGTTTTDWAALAPVNEQVRPDNDAWLAWVRAEIARQNRTEPSLGPDDRRETYAIYSTVVDALANGRFTLPGPIGPVIKLAGVTTPAVDREHRLDSIAARAPGVSDEAIADFRRASTASQPVVAQGWQDPARIAITPVTAIDRFAKDPLVAFSPVGFDPSRTHAIVYVHFSSSYFTGAGFYAVLAKQDGAWRLSHVDPIWNYKG